MANQNTHDVAAEVRAAAARLNLKQSALAETLGVTRMSLSRRMNGTVGFSADELIALSRALGVPVASFFGESAA